MLDLSGSKHASILHSSWRFVDGPRHVFQQKHRDLLMGVPAPFSVQTQMEGFSGLAVPICLGAQANWRPNLRHCLRCRRDGGVNPLLIGLALDSTPGVCWGHTPSMPLLAPSFPRCKLAVAKSSFVLLSRRSGPSIRP